MATSTGVNITSISVANGVVTVAASGHGLAVNQGFSLQGTTGGTYDCCGVVTAQNGSGFTFAQGSLPATGQAGAAGKVFPAKKVIILSTQQPLGVPEITVNYILWLTTQKPVPVTATSAWSGAGAAEVAAIGAGYFIERQGSKQFAQGDTTAAIQTELLNEHTAQQGALAAGVQPGAYYGVFADSVGWSA